MKIRNLLVLALLTFLPTLSFAQATRTWVSGVGDDANPCSRTAPGKTFAGAISKTAVNGVINVLNPGGFGAVTITKSITIDGGGIEGSILASGSTGVSINAGVTDIVILRNLTIEGTTTGLKGISIIQAGAVYIENCTISGFDSGIYFDSTAEDTQLFVSGTQIRKCKTDGIAVLKGNATIRNSFIAGIASITTSVPVPPALPVTTYFGNGIRTAAGAVATVENCTVSGNNFGITADGIIYVHGSTIANNAILGLKRTAPGAIVSLKDNRIVGNAVDGKVTKSLPLR